MNSKDLTTVQKLDKVRDLMSDNQDKMFGALPAHITPARMIRVACSSLLRNPKLLDCSQASLLGAITEAASLGLVPDGILGHAYLVPYGDKCTLIAGYRGLVQLCRQSGSIASFYAHVVRSADDFTYTLGTAKAIVHHPSDDEHDGTYTHAYAVAHYKDGGFDFDVMSFADVEKHKVKYSKGYKKADSPWNTAPAAMAKKTVIRQLIKLLPVSSEIQRLAAKEDLLDAGVLDATPSSKRVTRVELPDFSEQPDAEPEPESPPKKPKKKAPAETETDAERFEAEVPAGTTPDMFDGKDGNQP